jgi:hypothetical protein
MAGRQNVLDGVIFQAIKGRFLPLRDCKPMGMAVVDRNIRGLGKLA